MAYVLYLTTARIPGEKAHSLQIVRVCEALARIGCKVYLFPARSHETPEVKPYGSFQHFYGFSPSFSMMHIPSIDFPSRNADIRIQQLLFSVVCLSYFTFILPIITLFHVFKGNERTILYIREPLLFIFFTVSKPIHRLPILFEIHRSLSLRRSKSLYLKLLSRVDIIVTISRKLKEDPALLGVDDSKIVVAHSAVDVKPFDKVKENMGELRRALKMPVNHYLAVFLGHLYKERRVEGLIDAVKLIKEKTDLTLYIVGGKDEDVKRLLSYAEKVNAKGVIFTGFVNPSTVPIYLKAADVLLLPPFFQLPESSPLVLFEYMAARRPIIAPNIPSIREVLENNESGLLYDNIQDLTNDIVMLYKNPDLATKLASNAYNIVKAKYTHKARAKTILDALNRL